jgi:hypothetical protein
MLDLCPLKSCGDVRVRTEPKRPPNRVWASESGRRDSTRDPHLGKVVASFQRSRRSPGNRLRRPLHPSVRSGHGGERSKKHSVAVITEWQDHREGDVDLSLCHVPNRCSETRALLCQREGRLRGIGPTVALTSVNARVGCCTIKVARPGSSRRHSEAPTNACARSAGRRGPREAKTDAVCRFATSRIVAAQRRGPRSCFRRYFEDDERAGHVVNRLSGPSPTESAASPPVLLQRGARCRRAPAPGMESPRRW